MMLDRYFSHKERKGRKAFVLSVLFVASFILAGCVYKGAKVVEGTDLAVGFTVPQTEGVAQLDILNYLSGFRLGVAENAALKVKYTVSETNSYFGCVTTRTQKTIDAKVEPCETSSTGQGLRPDTPLSTDQAATPLDATGTAGDVVQSDESGGGAAGDAAAAN